MRIRRLALMFDCIDQDEWGLSEPPSLKTMQCIVYTELCYPSLKTMQCIVYTELCYPSLKTMQCIVYIQSCITGRTFTITSTKLTDLSRCKRLLGRQAGVPPSQKGSNVLNCSTVRFCPCRWSGQTPLEKGQKHRARPRKTCTMKVNTHHPVHRLSVYA